MHLPLLLQLPDVHWMREQGKVLLKLEWSSRVYGSVEGLFVIPQKSRAEDTLLFVFDEGKMCLCSFDRQRMQLVTLKLWNAEEHAIGLGTDYVGDSRGRNIPLGAGRTPLTAVSSRGLACTLLYGHQLLFYPTQLAASNSSQFSLKPLLVNLEDIGLPGAVVDICFVEGYLMPAVAILQVNCFRVRTLFRRALLTHAFAPLITGAWRRAAGRALGSSVEQLLCQHAGRGRDRSRDPHFVDQDRFAAQQLQIDFRVGPAAAPHVCARCSQGCRPSSFERRRRYRDSGRRQRPTCGVCDTRTGIHI